MAVKGSDQRFPVRRVYCLGRNYRAHAIESGDNPDETPPFFFMKPRDAVVDSGDGFPYPPMTKGLRYEAEMVVALRSSGSDIKPASDLDHVYGYGIGLVEKGDLVRADIDGLGEIEVRII
jgi:fumarylpyruvate hydrolase